MATAKVLRKSAWNALKGKWHICIAITLLSLFVGIYSMGPLPNVGLPMEEWIKDPSVLVREWDSVFYLDRQTLRAGLFFLLGAAGVLGHCYCYLLMTEQEACRIRDLFHCYPQIVSAIALRLLRWVYTILGLSAFLIPGIYIRYVYALAPWIMADAPGIGARQALIQSKRMMKGNKWRLFMLDLSFAGWLLLCVLSLGTGFLFLIPYHAAARAAFFKELKQSGTYSGFWHR